MANKNPTSKGPIPILGGPTTPSLTSPTTGLPVKMPPPPLAQLPLRPIRGGTRNGGRGSLVSGGLNVTPALTSPRALTGGN